MLINLNEAYPLITRVELIDHSENGKGRVYTKWEEEPVSVTLDLQDGERTLKIFIND